MEERCLFLCADALSAPPGELLREARRFEQQRAARLKQAPSRTRLSFFLTPTCENSSFVSPTRARLTSKKKKKKKKKRRDFCDSRDFAQTSKPVRSLSGRFSEAVLGSTSEPSSPVSQSSRSLEEDVAVETEEDEPFRFDFAFDCQGFQLLWAVRLPLRLDGLLRVSPLDFFANGGRRVYASAKTISRPFWERHGTRTVGTTGSRCVCGNTYRSGYELEKDREEPPLRWNSVEF